MRFTQIQFEKVGPFTDTTLNFKKAAGLHLINGPNEAGKSSALRQILAFLFGFVQQSGDNFVHEYRQHRVSSKLEHSVKGSIGPVVRKRGNSATLEGAKESDLHPPHIGREEFERLFAIDQERLRKGSEELFKGQSDLKTILFESMTGMTSISSIRKDLRERKEELLKARSGEIHVWIGKVKEAQEKEGVALGKLNEKGAEVREYQATCANLVRTDVDLKKQRQEKSRLERLFRGLGTLMELRQKEAELNELGTLPSLGVNFGLDWEKARDAKARMETTVVLEGESLKQLRIKIDSIPEPKWDASIQDRIQGLIRQIAEVEGAFRDLPEQVQLRDDRSKEITEWVREWFPSKLSQDLEEWLPGDRERAQISQAASGWQSAQSREAEASKGAELAGQDLEILEKEAKELLPIEDLGRLVSVLDDLERLGFHEKSLYQAGDTLKRDRDAILSQAGRMVPPVEGEDALNRIAAPTLAEIQDIVNRFNALETHLSNMRTEIGTHANGLVIAESELQQLQARGVGKVSRADYESTKGIRDKAWELIRAERKGMTPETELVRNLIRDAGTGIDLDETLTGLMGRTDQQADSLLSDAEMVSKCELLRQKVNGLKRSIEDREEDLKNELARGEELRKAFAIQWAGWNAGSVVMENARGLPEWMKKVSDLREGLAKIDAQAAEHKGRLEELETLRKNLVQLLGSEGSVQELRAKAKAKIQANEERARVNASVTSRLETQKKSQVQAAKLLNDARRQLTQARETWDELTRSLGHPVHEGERVGLAEQFQNVRNRVKERSTAAKRAQDMETTLERFLKDLAGVTTEVGAGMGPWDQASWRGKVLGLQNLLAEDQENRTAKKNLGDQLEAAQLRLSQAQTAMSQNLKALGELLQQTGCSIENDVPALLERIAKKTGLERDISSMRGRLSSDMKMPLEEYLADLGDQKGPELEGKIQDLDQESERLEQEIKSLSTSKQQMESVLGDLVQSKEAAVARQEFEDAKVRLGEVVRDWKLQHLSLLCLNEAIERNRQSSAETPLSRAAGYFQEMTLGRFTKVEFEDDGGKLVLKVARAGREDFMEFSGTQGSGLSEGTADQLWLALRLAGIESRVDQMIREGMSPMPVILDDVLVTFDDDRTQATLKLLAELGKKTQVFVFTHHTHVCELARKGLGDQVDVVDLLGRNDLKRV